MICIKVKPELSVFFEWQVVTYLNIQLSERVHGTGPESEAESGHCSWKQEQRTGLTLPPGPPSQPSSSHTLLAKLTAEILRGWVQMMLHFCAPHSFRSRSSNRKCGTWVLLPLPVSPATTTTRCLFRVSTMESRCLNTGNCCLSFRSL